MTDKRTPRKSVRTRTSDNLAALTRLNAQIAAILELAEEAQRLSGAIYWRLRRRKR